MRIGVLSRQTGVNIETIRYYERIGIMPKPDRSAGGCRLYDLDQLKRLSFVKRSRELGFSLDDIRRLLGLADGGRPCGEVKAITDNHLAGIRKKIMDLQRLEQTLKAVSSRCVGDKAPECPVIEALYKRPRETPGRKGDRG
jgi:MerR family mercuric resistance operon transcriptional regulator